MRRAPGCCCGCPLPLTPMGHEGPLHICGRTERPLCCVGGGDGRPHGEERGSRADCWGGVPRMEGGARPSRCRAPRPARRSHRLWVVADREAHALLHAGPPRRLGSRRGLLLPCLREVRGTQPLASLSCPLSLTSGAWPVAFLVHPGPGTSSRPLTCGRVHPAGDPPTPSRRGCDDGLGAVAGTLPRTRADGLRFQLRADKAGANAKNQTKSEPNSETGPALPEVASAGREGVVAPWVISVRGEVVLQAWKAAWWCRERDGVVNVEGSPGVLGVETRGTGPAQARERQL